MRFGVWSVLGAAAKLKCTGEARGRQEGIDGCGRPTDFTRDFASPHAEVALRVAEIRMTTQNEPPGARRRAKWYGEVPVTDEQKRAAIERFLNWRFPEREAIAYLQEGWKLNREHLDWLERDGHSGRAVEIVRSRVMWHELEIGKLRNACSMAHQLSPH